MPEIVGFGPVQIQGKAKAGNATKDIVVMYLDSKNHYRWRRVAPRGNLPDLVVADSGEGYSSREHCEHMIATRNPGLPVVDLTKEK